MRAGGWEFWGAGWGWGWEGENGLENARGLFLRWDKGWWGQIFMNQVFGMLVGLFVNKATSR